MIMICGVVEEEVEKFSVELRRRGKSRWDGCRRGEDFELHTN